VVHPVSGIHKVLVVDDEQVIADTLAIILRNAGFEALTAYSGETAVALARGFRPEAVISDILMPGMDGIEACSRILESYPECKVLLISGQAGVEHHPLTTQLRMSPELEVLDKPVAPEELLQRLGWRHS